MFFRTHNETEIDPSGSHWQGDFVISYRQLVFLFGEPMFNRTEKTAEEWQILCGGGVLIGIYRRGYYGEGCAGPMPLRDRHPPSIWGVGGFDKRAIQRLVEIVAGDHDRLTHSPPTKEAA